MSAEYHKKEKIKTLCELAQIVHESGEIRSVKSTSKLVLNHVCQIHVSFNFCTYVQDMSLEETNCRLGSMDTHSPESNCTATFIVSAWKNIPF